jgi:hypothetical protein
MKFIAREETLSTTITNEIVVFITRRESGSFWYEIVIYRRGTAKLWNGVPELNRVGEGLSKTEIITQPH